MPKDWKDIDIDEILNFEGAQTGEMARYDRIMCQKEIEALKNVHTGLFDLKKSLHRSTDILEQRLKESSKTQGRLQKITITLTVVIVLATVTYTWITWQTVLAQREANLINQSIVQDYDGASK